MSAEVPSQPAGGCPDWDDGPDWNGLCLVLLTSLLAWVLAVGAHRGLDWIDSLW